MEDYAAETWDLKLRIDVSSIQASMTLNLASPKMENKRQKKMETHVAPTTTFLSGIAMVNECELLARFHKHLSSCNTDGQWLGMTNIKG